MKLDHTKFFAGFQDEFDDTLDQAQVEGIEFLLSSFEANATWKDVRHIAYALGTVFHETAGSMQPIEEGYYLAKYGAGRVKRFQKTLRYYPYYGRGYVQLTWNSERIPNYQKASDALGINFVKHPDLVMVKENAFQIMTLGMFQGWFTSKKLSNFIHGSTCDYKNARKIINGLDKANLIAGYAVKFEQILQDSIPAATAANDDVLSSDSAEIQDKSPASTLSASSAINPALPDASGATIHQEADSITNVSTGDTPTPTQDINEPATVKTNLYQQVGLMGVLKKDFAAVGGGNISFQSLQSYAQDASGWPPWVISLITKLATAAIILGALWLIYRLAHYGIWKIGEMRQQKLSAEINSDVSRKDLHWTGPGQTK